MKPPPDDWAEALIVIAVAFGGVTVAVILWCVVAEAWSTWRDRRRRW